MDYKNLNVNLGMRNGKTMMTNLLKEAALTSCISEQIYSNTTSIPSVVPISSTVIGYDYANKTSASSVTPIYSTTNPHFNSATGSLSIANHKLVAALMEKQQYFKFANLLDIWSNMVEDRNIEHNYYTYTYHDSKRGIICRYLCDDREMISIFERSNGDERNYCILSIIENLAYRYESVLKDNNQKHTEEVLKKMKDNFYEFDKFFRYLTAFGGCYTMGFDSVFSKDADPDIEIKVPLSGLKQVLKMSHEKMPKVASVDTYNDRVVKVTFDDGTFTKAVCSQNDMFSLDVGISICMTKRMMGKDGHKLYNDMMRDVYKKMEDNMLLEKMKNEMKYEEKERRKKEAQRKAVKKAKRRAEAIDIQKTAFVEALREDRLKNGDDGK